MALVRGSRSEKANQARRRNAENSTGPRTAHGKLQVSFNAWKAGTHASSPQGIMRLLGESPEEFDSMLEELTATYNPQTCGERLQLEQIASLHWQLRRNLEARLWKMVRRQEELQQERERQWMEADSQYCQASFEELMSEGLIRRPEGPAKFTMLLEYLGILTRAAEARDFEIDFEKLLRLIYGQRPTLRGNTLLNCFRQCAADSRPGVENPDQYQLLLRTLYEEDRDTLAAQQHYMRSVVEISAARRQAALAPSWDDRPVLEEQNLLVYQLESAYRVFFGMRRERRAVEESTSQGSASTAGVSRPLLPAALGPAAGEAPGESQAEEENRSSPYRGREWSGPAAAETTGGTDADDG